MRPMPPPMNGGRGPRGFLTEQEKANRPQITKELLLRIISYLKPYKWHFLLVFLSLSVSAVLGLLPSVITGKIVDTIVAFGSSKSLTSLVSLVALAFGVMLALHRLSVF